MGARILGETAKVSDNKENMDFFVVGGPVMPGKACYLPRPADAQILRFLDMGESCTLFMPNQCGKTSLIKHCARRLRKDGRLAAVVDLTQMGTLEHRDEPSRWFYTIAYRIVRDLRLKVDLQQWWRDHATLSNQDRMSDFYWEIVLGNTSAPIVIFFDDLETLVGLPSAREFLSTIRACSDRRTTEPEYQRLGFVLSGVSHPNQFNMDQDEAPFEVCYPLVLEDFTLEALQPFSVHLDPDVERAGQALARIYHWTGGHPYLTQKLCRSLVRQGLGEDPEASVDAAVESLFLQANSVRNEPHLNSIRYHLLNRDDKRNRLLALYGRLRKGGRIRFDSARRNHVELLLSGVVRVDDMGLIKIRNEIYAAQFTAGWVNRSLPLDWRGLLQGLGVLVMAVFLPYWYTQWLPVSYTRVLEDPRSSFQEAENAHTVFGLFPGYGDNADQLYQGYLLKRGVSATELTEVNEASDRLVKEFGDSQAAEQLIAGFWQRKASQAEALEDRDAALMFRLRAMEMDGASATASALALAAEDYANLVSTIRPSGRLDRAVLSPDGTVLVTVESGNHVRRWDTATGRPGNPRPLELYAQEFIPVVRHLVVEQAGKIKALELSVTLNHFRPDDLAVLLTAPSGKSVTLMLRDAGEAREVDYIFNTATFAFSERSHKALAELVGEDRVGAWTLSVEDREEGVTGTLVAWGLNFGRKAAETLWERPEGALQVPDPRNTGQVRVELGPAGRLAAAVSAYDEPRGYIVTWDLLGREELARIPEPAGASTVLFAMQGEQLVVAGAHAGSVDVRDARSGSLRFELDAGGRLSGPPVLSADGRFLLLSAQRGEDGSAFRVFDLATGKRVRTLEFDTSVTHMALAAGGRRMAASFRDSLVRVWDLAAGRVLAELFHATPVTGLTFDLSGRWLLMSSRDRRSYGWNLEGLSSRAPAPDVVLDNWDAQSMVASGQPAQVLVQDRPGSLRVVNLAVGKARGYGLRHGAGTVLSNPDAPRPARPGQGLSGGFALGSTRMYTAERGGIVRVWNLPPDQEGGGWTPLPAAASRLAISPDGTTLAWGTPEGEVMLRGIAVDDDAPAPVGRKGHSARVNLLRYSHNGQWLISAADDGSLRVWDLAQDGASISVRNDLGVLRDAMVSEDGQVLASSGAYGARVWNARNGEPLFDVPALGSAPVIALRHDGAALLVQGSEGDLQLRETVKGDLLRTIGNGRSIRAARYSPDDRYLVLVDRSGEIRALRSDDYTRAGDVLHLGGEVTQLTFVPGGDAVVVRTHNWLHLLALGADGLTLKASRLASAEAMGWSVHFPDEQGYTMVYATAELGGEPRVGQLEFQVSGDEKAGEHASGLLRDWGRRLGLAISAEGRLERLPVED